MPEVEKLEVYGRKYIEYDSHLMIFKRQVPKRYLLDPSGAGRLTPGWDYPTFNVGGQLMYQVHAAGIISFRVPAKATRTSASATACRRGDLHGRNEDRRREICRPLDERTEDPAPAGAHAPEPAAVPDDRGAQELETELPPHGEGA